ncbi:Non-specific serine/threonine protein kinase [Caenorhabditis elegans]|uniref:Non-specific serine/threonine protein kinase n=1 Tax=Caenorhabditis elegans TaxID=6239 RepID=Q21287_CAEEL|nr:Non-specific serine/threonine protein kinase [Caenorhabditis elegans]CCD62521.2 Non-specific serine/threonine protein kinase [Caenorhabditis elegans]
MSKRHLDDENLSTYEIKRLRDEQLNQIRLNGLNKEGNLLNELERMSANAVREFLVTTCPSPSLMQARILQLKSSQKIDGGYFQILQIHGYVKFNEPSMVKSILKESISHNGSSFLNRVAKYIAQFCFNQSDYNTIYQWRAMVASRTEYDWQRAFTSSVLSSPERELPLLASLILLLPDPSPKNAAKVFSAIAKQEKLPECFEWLAKRAFQFVSGSAFHKSDVEKVTRKYLTNCFATCMNLRMKNKSKTQFAIEYSQNMFLERTSQIANKAFGIIRSTDENSAQNLLQDPCFQITKPSEMFIEYFLQYIKLGMFFFDDGDKLIAWNYYYDDRWCGYDRSDLFGEKFQLSESFRWFADFKFAGTINQHPHYANLIICSKLYEWMSTDEKMYSRLMKKYGNEELIQFFAISLSFAGCFRSIIELYDKYKSTTKSRHGWLCLRMCYMYSCAKEGMANEALNTWASIMDTSERADLLHTITFPQNSFPLPYFVQMKYAGQFATRLLRNCLWTAAIKEGTEGWKKYAMIILLICDTLEDSFLNHNMMRIMFQTIKMKDMPILFEPTLSSCLRQQNSYWDCLQIAKSRGFEIPKDRLKERLIPDAESERNEGFAIVYKKLKKLDAIFYPVVLDLPVAAFKDFREENMELFKDLPVESQERICEIKEYHENARKAARDEYERRKREEKERADMKKKQKEDEEEAMKNQEQRSHFFMIDDFESSHFGRFNGNEKDSDNQESESSDSPYNPSSFMAEDTLSMQDSSFPTEVEDPDTSMDTE